MRRQRLTRKKVNRLYGDPDNFVYRDFDNFDRSFWKAWWVMLVLIVGFWAAVLGVAIYAIASFS